MLVLIAFSCARNGPPAGAVPVTGCPPTVEGAASTAADLHDGQRAEIAGVVRQSTGLAPGEGWLVLVDGTELSLAGPLPHGWDGLLGQCVTTVGTVHLGEGKPWIESPDGPLPAP